MRVDVPVFRPYLWALSPCHRQRGMEARDFSRGRLHHIYVASDQLFREDKQGNYVDEDANIVDLCDEHVCLKPARVWDDIYRKKPEARKP